MAHRFISRKIKTSCLYKEPPMVSGIHDASMKSDYFKNGVRKKNLPLRTGEQIW